jgi:cell division protein FtsA
MSKEKYITGIDVGSDKISTIIASVVDNKVSVIGVSGAVPSKGVGKGVITDIDDAVEAIAHSLERAERMAGISVSSAFVVVNGSHIETLNSHGVVAVSHQGNEIMHEDVARVTDAAQAVSLPSSREIIHVIPRGFVVDGQDGIHDPVGMAGIRLEVETNIVHGSSMVIRNLVRCISQVGVNVEDLIFSGIASGEAVLTDTEKELGTLLVDIGGGTTSVTAFLDGSPVYSRVFPIGGKHITNDLAIGMRARLEAAEKIKLRLSDEKHSLSSLNPASGNEELNVSEFGLDSETFPKKFLYKIIDARLDEIFRFVELDLKKAGFADKLPAGAVVTGGAAQTFGVERVAKTVLRMPVRIGKPKGVTGLIDEIEGPSFSSTVGAILHGVNISKTKNVLSFDKSRGNMGNIISSFVSRLKSFLP